MMNGRIKATKRHLRFLSMSEIEKPECPMHFLQMRLTDQWDLHRTIYYCPRPGCKHRYVSGIGYTTTDEMPSYDGPRREN